MSESEKMELLSMDVAEAKNRELREVLAQRFPEIISDGEVDFDKLKRTLGQNVTSQKERFGLVWPGKAECMSVIQQSSASTLKPVRSSSNEFDNSKNIFIEGDNFEVLKLLQKTYFGKIKTIIIDPPYNTGSEFIYPDKFSETIQTYLDYTNQTDESGKRFSTNSDVVGRYHSNWLNMMFKRIFLARNLLCEDGIFFVCIDDHEVANLRLICDEIFGEECFLGNIVRATGQTTGQDSGGLGSSFDFILAYTKNPEMDLSGLPLTPHDLRRFENEDERGKYAFDQMRKTGSNDRRKDRPNMYYPVKSPDGEDIFPIGPTGYESCWRFERKTYEKLLAEDYIIWKKTKRDEKEVWWPYVKYYLEGRTKRPSPLWNELEGNKKAARDLRDLFDGKKVFDFPKPLEMLKRLIQIAPNASKDDLILDFFAGSCSTAHAVMDLNRADKGQRRFIMVQLPEPTDEGSEAKLAGYDTISEIGRDRIRRAAERLRGDSDSQMKLETEPTLDYGFKSFRLDKSNFAPWSNSIREFDDTGKQLDLHVEHIDGSSGPEDILYEILLKSGFDLGTKIETISVCGKIVYSIQDGSLLACLDKDITAELIDGLAELNPLQVICLDEGFKGNDQLKANAVQTFKARAQAEESEIVFRTV